MMFDHAPTVRGRSSFVELCDRARQATLDAGVGVANVADQFEAVASDPVDDLRDALRFRRSPSVRTSESLYETIRRGAGLVVQAGVSPDWVRRTCRDQADAVHDASWDDPEQSELVPDGGKRDPLGRFDRGNTLAVGGRVWTVEACARHDGRTVEVLLDPVVDENEHERGWLVLTSEGGVHFERERNLDPEEVETIDTPDDLDACGPERNAVSLHVRDRDRVSNPIFTVGRAASISYGPLSADSDTWTLRFGITDDERVSIRLDEDAMYKLWTEVKNRPWPGDRHDGRRRDELLTEIVTLANGASTDQLETLLDVLRGDEP